MIENEISLTNFCNHPMFGKHTSYWPQQDTSCFWQAINQAWNFIFTFISV